MSAAVALILGSLWNGAGEADEAERRAVAFLAAEVPRWARENHCYSCHNNGDAARALFRAKAAGMPFDESAIRDTLVWLARPEVWDKNGGEGPSSDKGLARIEFALALAAAVESGSESHRHALRRAADRLAADQVADGSWPVQDEALGSPATYGRGLATALSARVLAQADPERYAAPIARARHWVRSRRIASVIDAAAILFSEPAMAKVDRSEPARRALEFLGTSQAKSGGWGPYPDTPTEPFDTALALLAVAPHRSEHALAAASVKGRAALLAMQRPDGSWPETTRPAGGVSYAQRMSTAGWATSALIATRP
jgi:squalene cyclase